MLKAIGEFLGQGRYVERITCLTADPLIITAYTMSGMVIAISLGIIGLCLWTHRARGIHLTARQAGLVAVLVMLMALTSVMDVVLIFQSLYRLDVVVRAFEAGIAAAIAYSIVSGRRKK